MKIQLLSITLLMSSVAFAAEAPEIPANRAEKSMFAKVLAQINIFGPKKEEKPKRKVNKNSPLYVPTFDKDGNEIDDADAQPQVCGGFFGGHGDGWGMADELQMKEDGSIVPKQAAPQKPALDPEDDPLVQVCGGFVCGGFGDHGDGWGMADGLQMANGNIVAKQADPQKPIDAFAPGKLSCDTVVADEDGNIVNKY